MKRKLKRRLIGDGLGDFGRRLFCEQMAEVNAKIKQMEQEKETAKKIICK